MNGVSFFVEVTCRIKEPKLRILDLASGSTSSPVLDNSANVLSSTISGRNSSSPRELEASHNVLWLELQRALLILLILLRRFDSALVMLKPSVLALPSATIFPQRQRNCCARISEWYKPPLKLMVGSLLSHLTLLHEHNVVCILDRT